MVKIEKESSYKKLNGTMSGEEFRQWRANLYDEAYGSLPRSDSRGAGELVRTMGVQAGKERVC